jgi:hypothetical protein
LTNLVKKLDRLLIIFFDEADCLSEGTLISFLRQLRNGYNNRNTVPFIHSLALAGMRNICDFKVKIRPDMAYIYFLLWALLRSLIADHNLHLSLYNMIREGC